MEFQWRENNDDQRQTDVVVVTDFCMEFHSLKSLFLKLFAFEKVSITTWWAYLVGHKCESSSNTGDGHSLPPLVSYWLLLLLINF